MCVFCTEEDINVDGGTVSPAHMAGSDLKTIRPA